MASRQKFTLMGLPTEILDMFLPFELASRSGADLKQFRLMNRRLSEFVEPFLFRCICLSKVEENLAVWKAITNPNNRLRHHVEHICIDSTWFTPRITKAEYCVRLAQHIKEIDSETSSAQGGMAQIYTRRNLFTNLHYKKQGKNLLPGDKGILWNGYKEYLRHAESQAKIGSDGVYEALVTGLPQLPKVEGFSFMTEWPVNAPAVRRWRESVNGHANWEEGSFILPGPMARRCSPLQLPPQSTWSDAKEDGISALAYECYAVLRACNHLNFNPKTLIYPKPNTIRSSSMASDGTLSSPAKVAFPIEAISELMQPRSAVVVPGTPFRPPPTFRLLRKLDLAIGPPPPVRTLILNPFSTRILPPQSDLPSVFGSMPALESLTLTPLPRRSGEEEANPDTFTARSVGSIFAIREWDHPNTWHPTPSPTTEIFLYSDNAIFYSRLISVRNVPHLPSLRHLSLSHLPTTTISLVSLLRRVAPTLQSLRLDALTLFRPDALLFGWPNVLHALRTLFSRRLESGRWELELELRFANRDYWDLLRFWPVLWQGDGEVEDEDPEVVRRRVEVLARYVTRVETGLRLPAGFVPMLG